MKLTFHGAVHEVGRSCIEIESRNTRLLLDCGVKLGEETEYPEVPKKIKGIDAGIITHAHLDHCAGLPYMRNKGLTCPLFVTPETKTIAKTLIKDFYHVESLDKVPQYPKDAMFGVMKQFVTKKFKQEFTIKDFDITFYDAGHIPGSALVVLEAEGKRVAYTGDINVADTRLMTGADLKIKRVDTLITETTYGAREHPDRKKTEQEFIAKVKETLKRGGSAYIPVFGVGRAQEILLLIHSEKWNVPVYLDGMSQDITDYVIQSESCRDPAALARARSKTIYLKGRFERGKAKLKQGIFITTSGMLSGGPILDYLKTAYDDAKSSILLTGYVIEGTNGRTLLDTGTIIIDNKKLKVKAEYHKYDFSAHAGCSELKKLIQKLDPKKLILVHGDDESLQHLANEEHKRREVFIPSLGSELFI